jgi:hypothetical protein
VAAEFQASNLDKKGLSLPVTILPTLANKSDAPKITLAPTYQGAVAGIKAGAIFTAAFNNDPPVDFSKSSESKKS